MGYTTNSMSLRNRRSIESIFYHYPSSKLCIFSNKLDINYIIEFIEVGLDIEIINYSLQQLLYSKELNIAKNIIDDFINRKLPKIVTGKYWYSHETDLIRLLTLYIYGGTYMDTDVVVINHMNSLQNLVAWESHSWLNGAVMGHFTINNPFIRLCIYGFLTTYQPNLWGY